MFALDDRLGVCFVDLVVVFIGWWVFFPISGGFGWRLRERVVLGTEIWEWVLFWCWKLLMWW